MQAAVAVGNVTFDLRTRLPAEQRDSFGAAGHRAVRRNRSIDVGVGIPAELEAVVDHVEMHQAGMWASTAGGLKPSAGAAILAIDRRRWRGGRCGWRRRW